MGLVLRCGARLRSCVCTEDDSTRDGRNPAIDAWLGADDNDGRGLV